jgi:formate hydrogenlyase subunit 3/multisubunit Na+/H+ antiporter MnhD subunit
MSAPVLWILVPMIAGGIIVFIPRERTAAIQGTWISALLALIALVIPINTALVLGPFSLKIAASVQILGRSFSFEPADGPVLAVIYGLAALWFAGTAAASAGRRFVPLGLAITSLLVASIAVEPFLYAALFMEIAAMLAIPLLVIPTRPVGRGTLRFLIYQTLAMPFILFSGWMLAGVEASPGDIALTTQSGVMLGVGFAFLLAVFPLYNWIPMLAEETSPYVLGFMLWVLPTFAVIFALGFLDRYAWLRTSPQLPSAMRLAGLIMLVSSGWFAAFQHHIGRIMGYAAITETGLVLIIMTLGSISSIELVFILFISRGFELAVWGLSVSILKNESESLRFRSLQGLARSYPLVTAGLVFAHLSMTGFPLLAGFPPRLALWEQLARGSLGLALWLLVGLLGLLFGALRTLAVLAMAPENTPWKLKESRIQAIMLGVGVTCLFVIGMFPQVLHPFLVQLPSMFEHLAQ